MIFAAPLAAQVKNGYINLQNPERMYNLNGTWKFKPHDDLRYANLEHDDSNWKKLRLPGVWNHQGYDYSGTAWIRVRFRLSPDYKGRNLGIRVPMITLAHEVYVNGKLIGGRGKISPRGDLLVLSHQKYYYHIDSKYIRPDQMNLLALRISTNRNGGTYTHPIILTSTSAMR